MATAVASTVAVVSAATAVTFKQVPAMLRRMHSEMIVIMHSLLVLIMFSFLFSFPFHYLLCFNLDIFFMFAIIRMIGLLVHKHIFINSVFISFPPRYQPPTSPFLIFYSQSWILR